jgi:hypothetical protein
MDDHPCTDFPIDRSGWRVAGGGAHMLPARIALAACALMAAIVLASRDTARVKSAAE